LGKNGSPRAWKLRAPPPVFYDRRRPANLQNTVSGCRAILLGSCGAVNKKKPSPGAAQAVGGQTEVGNRPPVSLPFPLTYAMFFSCPGGHVTVSVPEFRPRRAPQSPMPVLSVGTKSKVKTTALAPPSFGLIRKWTDGGGAFFCPPVTTTVTSFEEKRKEKWQERLLVSCPNDLLIPPKRSFSTVGASIPARDWVWDMGPRRETFRANFWDRSPPPPLFFSLRPPTWGGRERGGTGPPNEGPVS